jgi:Tol biopolymer transport system component
VACALVWGSLPLAGCSGTAGELFPGGRDPTPSPLPLGAGGRGGTGATIVGGTTGNGGSASASSAAGAGPLVPAGGAGSGGGPGGAGEGPGAGSNGSTGGNEDAGAGPVAPPVCDPCPCSTGAFGAPELVQGLGVQVDSFGPAPSADASTLYFSAFDDNEDIFFATRSTRDNRFSVAALVSGVNRPDSEDGTPFITADDRSLYFFSTRVDADAPGERDLWLSTRASAADAFSTPIVVPDVNSERLEHLPRLTPDGLTLMFVSGRTAPNDFSNIWQARRASAQAPWEEAVELPGVNTNAREEGFWLSADGLTLFFASNRVGEVADMDIFVATRPDLESAFGQASGLDVVNTSDIELDPALTTDGFELFFASDRSGTMQLYRSARQCP